MISDRMRRATKLSRVPQYRLAQLIGVHPSTLSCWVNSITDPKPGDSRVLQLAQMLSVPDSEAFAEASRAHELR